MAIIHKSKKRKIFIGIVITTVVVVCSTVSYVYFGKNKEKDVKELETENIFVEEELESTKAREPLADDDRIQFFDYIDIFVGIDAGDMVDIRIGFPNGEDYVVLAHKNIISVDDAGMVLKVSEEDIMKMSSAKIDVNKYEGTRIYAVKYVDNNQKPATSYYLLNEYVLALCDWNPNLVGKIFTQEKLKKRYDFEQNLVKFQIEKEIG